MGNDVLKWRWAGWAWKNQNKR